MTVKIGIIGGTGLTSLPGLEITAQEKVDTPYGKPSAKLISGLYFEHCVVFLARHGSEHTIAPHKINYRANVRALKDAGATHIIAVNAVGGINKDIVPGSLQIPDQLIDYTWGRSHTFYEESLDKVEHVDFTQPYCPFLRKQLCIASKKAGLDVSERSVYAATQGPRLETAAEIQRLLRDGCDIVGMTGMPEAALAKELEICYACIALVVNPAAGLSEGEITMKEIEKYIHSGMNDVLQLLKYVIPLIQSDMSGA